MSRNSTNKYCILLLYVAQVNECVEIVTAFLLELINMTDKVHQDDYIFSLQSPIAST